jgi:hypothetical protein
VEVKSGGERKENATRNESRAKGGRNGPGEEDLDSRQLFEAAPNETQEKERQMLLQNTT